MSTTIDVTLFFNFRSPYCYLASKTLWPVVDSFDTRLVWRPVGGGDLRSPPDRARTKMPLARQDVARFARRMGIPMVPPPPTTDPTPAGLGSLLAEDRGLLRPYIVETMHREWGLGEDIGDPDTLLAVAARIGLDPAALVRALDSLSYRDRLAENAAEAARLGVIGVPSFIVGDQIFWGQDRIDFVIEELDAHGARRPQPLEPERIMP